MGSEDLHGSLTSRSVPTDSLCWERTKGQKNTEMEEEIVAMNGGKGRSWQNRHIDKISRELLCSSSECTEQELQHSAGFAIRMEEQEALAGMSQPSPTTPIWNNHPTDQGKDDGGAELPLI